MRNPVKHTEDEAITTEMWSSVFAGYSLMELWIGFIKPFLTTSISLCATTWMTPTRDQSKKFV
jgi:hypothetical protein